MARLGLDIVRALSAVLLLAYAPSCLGRRLRADSHSASTMHKAKGLSGCGSNQVLLNGLCVELCAENHCGLGDCAVADGAPLCLCHKDAIMTEEGVCIRDPCLDLDCGSGLCLSDGATATCDCDTSRAYLSAHSGLCVDCPDGTVVDAEGRGCEVRSAEEESLLEAEAAQEEN